MSAESANGVVKDIDREVAATGLAMVVFRVLKRDRRRRDAEHDARIYAAAPSPGSDRLAAWGSHQPMDID